MFRVILSDIDAVNNDAACCMVSRKPLGAAMAAASNKRLMVMPPAVMEVTVVGPLCAVEDMTASLARAVNGIFTAPSPTPSGLPPLGAAGGKKFLETSAPAVLRKPSAGSCRSVTNLVFI